MDCSYPKKSIEVLPDLSSLPLHRTARVLFRLRMKLNLLSVAEVADSVLQAEGVIEVRIRYCRGRRGEVFLHAMTLFTSAS